MGSVSNSVCPSVCPGFFLELDHYFFLNFGMVQETHMKLCVTVLDFPEKFFLPPKLGKWTKNEPTGFFEFIEKYGYWFLLNFFIKNIYIICFVPPQIPYLGKFLFLKYGPKCSKPMRLQDFLINHISRINQWSMKYNEFFFAWWYIFT